MRKSFVAVALLLAGCAAHGGSNLSPTAPSPVQGPLAGSPEPAGAGDGQTPTPEAAGARGSDRGDAARATVDGSWVGASAESQALLAGSSETVVGVWVDAPAARAKVRPKVDLALVIDVSGSMAGAKIQNARAAALALLDSLQDGDIVSLDTFSDDAHAIVTPTVVSQASRARIRSIVQELHPDGSTNMYDGLSLGESQVARAPATHTVRRVVLLSDGQANVGPSTPEALGLVAERGLAAGAQVTSLGVGIDYDERTLNALAVRSSGRLYHLGELSEMPSILRREMGLLATTVASDAFVEVVPAPGVQLEPMAGFRSEWGTGGTLRIPLGVLFGGQHREALLRARFVNGAAWASGTPRPLASVRLHFRDPNEADLERVQEVVARVETTEDGAKVEAMASARTRAIMAVQDAARLQIQAAQAVIGGNFDDADRQLAAAEKKLEAEAKSVHDETQRQRLAQAAAGLASTRAATAGAAAAPAPAQRARALELNSDAMHASGF